MKKSVGLLLLFLMSIPITAQIRNFTFDDETRQYYFDLPDQLSDDAPLVFVLHGYSGSASSIRNYSGMNSVANENGFAVCYPQGLIDEWGNSFWQVGYSFHSDETVDDVKFITSLAEHLQREYNLNSQNTFCTGMSNGGDMSYMLACKAPDVFSAVAPVAGCMMKWLYDSCSSLDPIPVLEIHGTNDNITYWNGDINDNQGYGPYLGTEAGIDFWVQKNNCTLAGIETLPNINQNDGSTVVHERYAYGLNGNEVWLYKVVNGGHDWPGSSGNRDINASEEIWEFFNLTIDNTTGTEEETNYQLPNEFVLHQNYPNPFNPVTTIEYSIQGNSELAYSELAFNLSTGKAGESSNFTLLSKTSSSKSPLPRRGFRGGFLNIQLIVYDLLGKEVATLINEPKAPGNYEVQFDAGNLPSGVYLYKLTAGSFSASKKLILLK